MSSEGATLRPDINLAEYKEGRAFDWVVTERRRTDAYCMHLVHAPDRHEKYHHWQLVSMDSFRNREAFRAFPIGKDGLSRMGKAGYERYFSLQRIEEWQTDRCNNARIVQQVREEFGRGGGPPFVDYWENKPVWEHSSVYEFYKFIGFDHRRNKYVAAPSY